MDGAASTSLSPTAASHHPKLRLPATCEPPSELNPPKQATWIVCPGSVTLPRYHKSTGEGQLLIILNAQVFGATGHMGRSLIRAILSHGDKCTAVGWTQEDTLEQMKRWHERNCLGLLCDVRVRETVDSVIKMSIEHWGNIDIIAK